jgi:DNA-binding XRE family transcriptional regulator
MERDLPEWSRELRAWRAELGNGRPLTQKVAAGLLGVRLRTLEAWEGGRRPEQWEMVRKLMELARDRAPKRKRKSAKIDVDKTTLCA